MMPARLVTEAEQCPVCLDSFDPQAMPPRLGECEHPLCNACAAAYLEIIARETKEFPIPCPTCRNSLDPQRCLALLTRAAKPPTLDRFEKLLVEKLFMPHIRYCPNEHCGQAFEWDNTPQMLHPVDFYRITCLFCYTEFCVQCRDKWHPGKTCQQSRQEGQDNDALQILARVEHWRPCPACGELVEKRMGDCCYIRCRCGQGFCHNCGVAYIATAETANNLHGTPGCSCGLWPNDDHLEEDLPDQDLMVPVPQDPIEHADAPAPHSPIEDAWNQAQQLAEQKFHQIHTMLDKLMRGR